MDPEQKDVNNYYIQMYSIYSKQPQGKKNKPNVFVPTSAHLWSSLHKECFFFFCKDDGQNLRFASLFWQSYLLRTDSNELVRHLVVDFDIGEGPIRS